MQLVSVAVPIEVVARRRRSEAELPLTVQLVSVAVPSCCTGRRRSTLAELPLTVQLVSVAVPLVVQAAAVDRRSCR